MKIHLEAPWYLYNMTVKAQMEPQCLWVVNIEAYF